VSLWGEKIGDRLLICAGRVFEDARALFKDGQQWEANPTGETLPFLCSLCWHISFFELFSVHFLLYKPVIFIVNPLLFLILFFDKGLVTLVRLRFVSPVFVLFSVPACICICCAPLICILVLHRTALPKCILRSLLL